MAICKHKSEYILRCKWNKLGSTGNGCACDFGLWWDPQKPCVLWAASSCRCHTVGLSCHLAYGRCLCCVALLPRERELLKANLEVRVFLPSSPSSFLSLVSGIFRMSSLTPSSAYQSLACLLSLWYLHLRELWWGSLALDELVGGMLALDRD